MQLPIHQSQIELVQGDITESETDAIVNAANSQLVLGAGVAGAIRTKGGPSIQEECDSIGHCPVGGAVITGGGNLKARHVIHAVGPRQGEGDEEEKLKNATLNSLKVADDNNLQSITFPAISTGIYGFPIDACARIMLTATREYLSGETNIKRVVFALFDEKSFKVFENQLKKI
ncbi:MAG: O-acetyl-ADP-ribose deacetylase [Nitrospinaceae bacterium]|nr:macro domain-containing protein [Nitrospinaceae bacterium]NIR55340.1 macro domain-containing protein [Nitrospinaceae bacterium]NIS85779.1 macro domain-containing protein [Nitrospinaceae bacterium]NIT82629.1 macro domain-containing protein [Nitrospinaceae bacterium]NIU44834.1 macro domain-containing protein [Nitrospinaceae bacterium]